MKRIIYVVLSLCLILALSMGITGCSEKTGQTASEEPVKIQIISTSDIHGKVLPYDYALDTPDDTGSLAQISSAVNEIMDDNTVLIDVGDTVQGNSSEMFFGDKEHPAVRAQNLMNYDVWVPGNHDFNFGMDVLSDVIGQHDCDVVCANVYYKDGTSIGEPYVILERAGIKIGIIGVVTQNIEVWDKINIEKAELTVTDPVEEISKYTKELRGQVDVLIAACHMGMKNENGLANSGALDLADKVPELDLILASHGHKQEEITENNVLITENLDSGKTASVISLTLEKDADGAYQVTDRQNKFIEAADYPADPKISEDELIKTADSRAKKYAHKVIARLANDYLAPPDEIPGIAQNKLQDTALAHLINDTQIHYSGCPISATALTASDMNLYKGDIKRKDLSNIYRFQNTLYKLRMTGSQLMEWVEYSARFYNTYQEGDLTISFDPNIPPYEYAMFGGIKYEIDISQPAGSRVCNLTLEDGSPLDPNKEYDVVTNNYLASTQLLSEGHVFDGEDEFPELVQIDVNGRIGSVRDMIAKYITKVKGVKSQDGIAEFTAEEITDDNATWKLVGCRWNAKKHKRVAKLVKKGKINIEDYQDQYGNMIRPITEKDLAEAGKQ